MNKKKCDLKTKTKNKKKYKKNKKRTKRTKNKKKKKSTKSLKAKPSKKNLLDFPRVAAPDRSHGKNFSLSAHNGADAERLFFSRLER